MEKKFRYLVPGDYMADPAVHVFDGKLYIYPSHDRESGVEENDNGDHFDMCDYHVFSTENVMNGTVTDHGVVLKVSDIPWAGRQLWDCDVACKNGNYYMYFPLKDRNDIFRIGVAVSDCPEGPFIPQPDPIAERQKKLIVYDPSCHHYSETNQPDWCEIVPGHFVLASEPELEEYRKQF